MDRDDEIDSNRSTKILCVGAGWHVGAVEHMSQDLLRVLQPLGHFGVLAIQSSSQWVLAPLALQVDICHQFLLARQDDFCFVSKVDLYDLVAEPEHDSVFCFHPFLDVAVASIRTALLIKLYLGIGIEIVPEMLEQSNLLLQLSLWGIVVYLVRSNRIGFIACLLLDIFESLPVLIHDNLG